mgnify:CR=1 FL=1
MRKKIMTLMMGMLLLLTACGQQESNSASKMLPVAAVQSAAQGVAGVVDKTADKAEMSQKEEKTEDSADAPLPIERANASENTDNAAEKQPAPAETAPPAAPKEPATPASAPEDKPAPAPTPVPTPAEEKQEEPTPEPTPTPKPAASGNIYSIAEAIQAGNEYARAQYGVTIDTSMTTADSSYFPGTADSVAWLAENGGQAALTAAVKGNVDATFACLAAMDGAETVSAYARFNCTVRYDAASDEYIVVVLYG